MLRKTLGEMENMGKYLECDKKVSTVYELGGVLKHFDNKMPILFNDIENYSMRAAGGLYGDRDLIYKLLNMTHENRIFKFMEAIANPKPYKEVSTGPVKENIINKNYILDN